MDQLIQPHGGHLVDCMASPERVAEIKAQSKGWASWDLTLRQICDLELLLSGGFSPLAGFMTRKDYDPVCREMRLADGTLWPMPITLDISKAVAETLQPGDMLALRDREGVMLAALHIEDLYHPNLDAEAQQVFGTTDPRHPAVGHLQHHSQPVYVGGRLEGCQLPIHYDFRSLRRTPRELREEFKRLGWRKIVAFQTRNPMHRAHHELTLRASKELQANLLIHPAVGMTQPGDLDHFTRVRCYQSILSRLPQHTAALSLLPLAMRMGGPREALWHAIIRRNYGCTHFIVGRDHAGPKANAEGKAYYGDYDAQELIQKYQEELGVEMVPFQKMVYVEEKDRYFPSNEVPEGARVLSISGTELRSRLADGREIPDWFTFPEVAKALQQRHPPRHRRGFTVFFTGLSGSGKSTIANVLLSKFLEIGTRPVTLLDGDVVRKHLSSELGFSKEHRNINIARIGYVASEITKNFGIAVCAPIAPYAQVRDEVRKMIEPLGGFLLVHVATPLAVCEARDRKGLYAKARAGVLKEFTGISDPYEAPTDAELVLDTTNFSAEESAQSVLLYLEREGYLGAARQD